jgi:hypothetical protein
VISAPESMTGETFEAKANPQELETVYDIQSGSRALTVERYCVS